MKKLYLKPCIEIIRTENVLMDTDSTGWRPGGEALAKPNTPMFVWDDESFGGDLWTEDDDSSN